jgi:FlaA1/EpsC-like NDP-sugar epimerase
MISRSALVFIHDLFVAAAAWIGAYWLRFNFDIPQEFTVVMWSGLLFVVPLHGAVFYAFGLYRGLWRFASVSDLMRISAACAVMAAAMPAALLMFHQAQGVPRSVYVLAPLLLVILMGGSRFVYRAWKDGRMSLNRSSGETRVLIVGAGETAANLVRELERSDAWQVVGIVDEHAGQFGHRLAGITILGGIDSIAEIASRHEATHAIIAMPTEAASVRRHVAEAAAAAGLSVFTVPAVDDLLAGRVSVSSVRRVELEDLLGRDRVELDEAGLRGLLHDRVVLVTGAGGSIGSELCRQIMHFEPRHLVFYELSEFALYAVEQEFAAGPITCVVGDVKDASRMAAVFEQYRPQVVFHAAAYKHVPLMEADNAWEAVRNNVLGTCRVARTAIDHGVQEFVLISTDKAVNPANVMGTTKRLAEMACQALQVKPSATRFVMVRFGNVLGSSGSVIPKFREQIAKGGPVTVTHPDIIRYFMLIPEAAQLVLQAAAQGQGGEIFVLDMGEPVNITDLARDMIRLSGFTEDDIKIEFTGLRPGEKLYEELLADGETTLPTPHPKLRVMKAEQAPDAAWLAELEEWLAAPVRAETEVKEGLKRWVPEYRPAQH